MRYVEQWRCFCISVLIVYIAATFVVSQLSEQILRDLVPSISAKIKDSVKDTVREAVKAQLPSSFRDSFESALLPAFEVSVSLSVRRRMALLDTVWHTTCIRCALMCKSV